MSVTISLWWLGFSALTFWTGPRSLARNRSLASNRCRPRHSRSMVVLTRFNFSEDLTVGRSSRTPPHPSTAIQSVPRLSQQHSQTHTLLLGLQELANLKGPSAYTGPSGVQRCTGPHIASTCWLWNCSRLAPKTKDGQIRRLRTMSPDYNSQKTPRRGCPRAFGLRLFSAFPALDYICHKSQGANDRRSPKSPLSVLVVLGLRLRAGLVEREINVGRERQDFANSDPSPRWG